MTSTASTLSPEFIASQKARLLATREELTRDNRTAASEEARLQADSLDAPEGSGDDAQKTNLRDNDAALFEHNVARVASIDRALQKIEDGTYGVSDASGKPIPKERLQAVPESLGTVDEQGG